MSIWKRAFLYLIRKKGRSLILIGILFVMSNFILAGLSLKLSADNEEDKIRSSLGSSFKIKSNVNNPDNIKAVDDGVSKGSMYNGAFVTKEMISKILKIDGITDYVANYESSAWVNLKLRPAMYTEEIDYLEKHPEYKNDYELFSFEDFKMLAQDTLVIPCKNIEQYEYFRTGACTMSEGRSIQSNDEYKVVISTDLAKRNQLSIGDTFIMEIREMQLSVGGDSSKRLGDPVDVEIIGLFSVHFEQEYSVYVPEFKYIDNLIFSDWTTADKLGEYTGETVDRFTDVTFFVDDPKNVDAAIRQIKDQKDIDLEDMIIKPDDSDYEAAIQSLEQIKWLALVLIITGIAGCMLILYFVSAMWVKSRKKEMQILLVIGSTRKAIMCQMLLEYVIIAVIALSITFIMSEFIITGILSIVEQLLVSKAGTQEFVLESEVARLLPKISKATPDNVALNYRLSPGIALTLVAAIISTLGISLTVTTRRMFKKVQSLHIPF